MTNRPTPHAAAIPTEDAHSVSLIVPLDLRHASTARMVAASLAADAGFSVDEIDDLRLGINEVVSVLADEQATDPQVKLTIDFVVAVGRVEATVARSDRAGAAVLDELAQRILDAVTDRYEYERGSFKIFKSATQRGDGN